MIPRKGVASEIIRALRLILAPGQVMELRALDAVPAADRRPHTQSGYFDDPEKLAHAAVSIVKAKGIYFTPNPVNPALLARAANRIRPVGKEPLTSDRDIIGRRWLLIDVDPVRPSGISSTDFEHELAIERAREIRTTLSKLGWPDPILADSGNGGHLPYRIDLPADDGGLVQRVLEALALRFSDDKASVDTSVFNPARIWKLYGTVARKGNHMPDRPHRMARLLEAPDALAPVSRQLLEDLAATLPPTPGRQARKGSFQGNREFDLSRWITEHNLPVVSQGQWRDGRKWVLNPCPWNSDHTNRSAYIVQHSNGAIAAGSITTDARARVGATCATFTNRNGAGGGAVPPESGVQGLQQRSNYETAH